MAPNVGNTIASIGLVAFSRSATDISMDLDAVGKHHDHIRDSARARFEAFYMDGDASCDVGLEPIQKPPLHQKELHAARLKQTIIRTSHDPYYSIDRAEASSTAKLPRWRESERHEKIVAEAHHEKSNVRLTDEFDLGRRRSAPSSIMPPPPWPSEQQQEEQESPRSESPRKSDHVRGRTLERTNHTTHYHRPSPGSRGSSVCSVRSMMNVCLERALQDRLQSGSRDRSPPPSPFREYSPFYDEYARDSSLSAQSRDAPSFDSHRGRTEEIHDRYRAVLMNMCNVT